MKKGFTLIELLGVIILLGILALIAYPIIDSSLKKSKEAAYNTTVKGIENAAKLYVTNNLVDYRTTKQKLSLDKLKEAGLLNDEDLRNPIDNAILGGCVFYNWNESKNQYEYQYDPTCDPSTDLACFEYEDAIKSYDVNLEGCKTYIMSLDMTEDRATTICSGGSIEGITLDDYIGISFSGIDFTIPTLIRNNVITNVTYEGIKITKYKCGGLLNINFTTEKISITDGEEMNPIIPKKIDGKDVVEIGTGAFAGITPNLNSNSAQDAIIPNPVLINTLELPSTIKKISVGAFMANTLTGLDFSTIPQLEKIGIASFTYSNISTMDLSKNTNLKNIGKLSFCMIDIDINNLNNRPNMYDSNVILPSGYSGSTDYGCPKP